ncbi:DinB family protein [Candidatus Leptofilum sp.]|uniref:DinB family protein n=1 Tax=Candidatus Leptofilum sp. TaxID=3241576 RepID=UPI003B5BF31B
MQKEITSQYLAVLEMMKQVIAKCPDDLWQDASHTNPFWHVAYHALFYTHLYAQPEEATFVPWEKHRPNVNGFGPPPWAPDEPWERGEPYSQADLLDYLAICQNEVTKQTSQLNPEAPSGFSWIPLNKLELQFYNIRHLQLHIGELCERLWAEAGAEIGWVGKFPND